MNNKNRKFENKQYIEFIHALPCVVSGKCGEGIHAHHVAPKGMGGIVNDYYALPLWHDIHVSGSGHISRQVLQDYIDEPLSELIIFHNSLYIEFISGRYSPDMDIETDFYTYKKLRKIH